MSLCYRTLQLPPKPFLTIMNNPSAGCRVSVPKQSVSHVIVRNPERNQRGRSNLKLEKKKRLLQFASQISQWQHDGSVRRDQQSQGKPCSKLLGMHYLKQICKLLDSSLSILITHDLSKVIFYTINSIYPIEITQEILKCSIEADLRNA